MHSGIFGCTKSTLSYITGFFLWARAKGAWLSLRLKLYPRFMCLWYTDTAGGPSFGLFDWMWSSEKRLEESELQLLCVLCSCPVFGCLRSRCCNHLWSPNMSKFQFDSDQDNPTTCQSKQPYVRGNLPWFLSREDARRGAGRCARAGQNSPETSDHRSRGDGFSTLGNCWTVCGIKANCFTSRHGASHTWRGMWDCGGGLLERDAASACKDPNGSVECYIAG